MKVDKKIAYKAMKDFLNKSFEEEMRLSKIIDGERYDSDGLIFFRELERWLKTWMNLFYELDEKTIDNYFSHIVGTYTCDDEFLMEKFKVPTLEQVNKCFNEVFKINFPILKEEYADKTFYKWCDEMVDIICPEFAYQPLF